MIKKIQLKECGFCGKNQKEIYQKNKENKLIAGRKTNICTECVIYCIDVMQERNLIKKGKN